MARRASRSRSEGGTDYYYAQGERIPVTRSDDHVAVVFEPRAGSEVATAFASGRSSQLEPSDAYPALQEGRVRIFRVADAPSSAELGALVREVRAEDGVEDAGPVYTDDSGRPLVLTDELVCKFRPELTRARITRILGTIPATLGDELGFSENAFTVRLDDPGEGSALAVANGLVEDGTCLWAYPNWIEHIGYRATVAVEDEVRHGVHPTDPQFANQWHHENTGQVAGGQAGTPGADVRTPLAWQVTMGNPAISVAVIDGGTDIAHSDLSVPGKLRDPIDLEVTPPDMNPVGGSHGTQVAGMAVAAANNTIVGSGSAPGCRLIAIKAGDTIAQLVMARGFEYAADHGADVITCSLGPVGQWIMTDGLREAIDYATTYGRDGRGCAYFQAVDNQPNPISVDQVSAYERSIAVSRTNNRDTYDGAATGVELDLSAPGRNVLTITNTTAANLGTQAVVTGTSFATPLTAGVGALVLSANPALSWQEVRQVLMDSADKIDQAGAAYAPAPATRPPGTRNDRCGYGRVNAAAAVAAAQAGSPRDLFVRDTTADDGSVPQPAWGFWDSPDIWVRNADDGGTVHQNTVRGQDNVLHCRVTNRGAADSHPCWARFYVTSFAGTEFRYPLDYKRNTGTTHVAGHAHPGNLRPAAQFPAAGTYLVGVQRLPSVPAGGSSVAKVVWPATLIPPAAGWHPCVLVEVSPHDGPAAAGPHVWERNNLAQKNLTIVDGIRGKRLVYPFRYSHPDLADRRLRLEILSSEVPADWTATFVPRNPRLVNQIMALAGDGDGIEPAKIGERPGLRLRPGTASIPVPLTGRGFAQAELVIDVPKRAKPKSVARYDVAQWTPRGKLVGGVRLEVRVAR